MEDKNLISRFESSFWKEGENSQCFQKLVEVIKFVYASTYFNHSHEIGWNWLNRQKRLYEGEFVRHVSLKSELVIKTDGRKRLGVILK